MNVVHLFGRAGRDPEVHHTQAGQIVVDIRMSTCEAWYDKDRKRREKTEWHNLVFWDMLADEAVNSIHKGDYFGVDGRMETRLKKSTGVIVTEVIVEKLHPPMIPFAERGLNAG
jgi:single-strand DNA-binding protein